MNDLIKLVKPALYLKDEYINLLRELKVAGEELIPWSLQMDSFDFEGMVNDLTGFSKGVGLPDGYVPVSVFWLTDENNRILGVIDIRHQLNDSLKYRGGHIGYGIRPTERKKGYATAMLHLCLKECERLGIKRVLITCSKSNVGSAQTIIHNGGILESENDEDGVVFQRYRIKL